MSSSQMTPEKYLEVARDTMRSAGFGFLVTTDLSDRLYARLMQPFEPEDDWRIWLGTSPRTRKITEISHNENVLLAFSNVSLGAYVTVAGPAALVTDVALRKKYWRDEFEMYWPAGPSGDDYVLICVTPERIELVNDAAGVSPEPKGLKCVSLELHDGEWKVVDS